VLSLSTESLDGVPFLRLSGSIARGDSNDEFVAAIHRLFESSRIVACDLSQVSSIDSTGVATLIAAHGLARSGGKRFLLIKPSAKVQSVLKVTRLLDILEVFSDDETALKAIQDRSR
jgi:anti-sigma B factor antagonist